MDTRPPTAGIYAKRDIILNEELLTGYGKPQWIYAIHFFSHLLSQRTIRETKVRYHISNKDTLAPQFAAYITTQPSTTGISNQHHRDPRFPSDPANSTMDPTSASNKQQDTTVPITPSSTAPDAPMPPTANIIHQPLEQTTTVTINNISTNHPTAPSGPLSNSAQQPTNLITDNATPPLAPPTQVEYPWLCRGCGSQHITNFQCRPRTLWLTPTPRGPTPFCETRSIHLHLRHPSAPNLCYGRKHFVLTISLEHHHRSPAQISCALN